MSDDFWANEDWDSRATQVGATGRREWRISGRGMVLALLAFGVLTTSAMWIYWTLHVGPFRPFQDSLAAAFPHSSPRVDGGQRKMHKGTPKILRVVMRVEFDPVTELARGEEVVSVVEQIARKHLDLDAYEELEVFLFQGVPEQEVRQEEYKRTLRPSAKSGKSEKVSQNSRPSGNE
jgi:hypothetical protein